MGLTISKSISELYSSDEINHCVFTLMEIIFLCYLVRFWLYRYFRIKCLRQFIFNPFLWYRVDIIPTSYFPTLIFISVSYSLVNCFFSSARCCALRPSCIAFVRKCKRGWLEKKFDAATGLCSRKNALPSTRSFAGVSTIVDWLKFFQKTMGTRATVWEFAFNFNIHFFQKLIQGCKAFVKLISIEISKNAYC